MDVVTYLGLKIIHVSKMDSGDNYIIKQDRRWNADKPSATLDP